MSYAEWAGSFGRLSEPFLPMRRLPFLLALLFPLAQAQEVAFEAALPDTVVVTASRAPEAAHRAGHVVEVITAEEIRALPVRSIDELLQAVGGVEVQSRGGLGVQSDLTLRGASFNGTVLLLDGARLNDSQTGHFLTDLPVPLSEIARVEVLRGPAAALYGPDAIGGVIHLITYAGLAQGGPSLTADARGGEYGTYEGQVAARGGARTAWSAAVQGARSDGEAVFGADGAPVVNAEGAVRTDFERVAGSAAVSTGLGGGRLYARVGADRRDFGALQFYTDFASDQARERTRTLWAQTRYAAPAGLLGLDGITAHLTARVHGDWYRYSPATSEPNEHTSHRYGATLAADKRLSPSVRLSGGLSGEARAIRSNNLGEHDDQSAGAYGLVQWDAAPGFVLTASARADYDALYGVQATPMLAAGYVASPSLRLRAVAGRAVRAPDYNERYFSAGQNIGNPYLDAERAWNAEAGVDLTPAPGLLLRATGFWRRTDDLIDYARTVLAPGDTVFQSQNVLQTTTRGLELDAEVRRRVGPVRLTTRAGYTLLDTDLATDRAPADLKYALTHSRHHLRGSVTAALGGASLGAQAFWKERLDGETYGVVHLRAGYAVPVFGSRVGLHGEVQNLFDRRYAEVFGAPMPGRRWLVGARLMLGR